jgi:hypothetical protein
MILALRMMLDHFCFNHIDYIFGDIGGMITDTLKMAGNQK